MDIDTFYVHYLGVFCLGA